MGLPLCGRAAVSAPADMHRPARSLHSNLIVEIQVEIFTILE